MAPPNTTKRKSLKELTNTERSEDLRPAITVITGQPGAGKTTLAASAFSPEVAKRLLLSPEELAKAPMIELKGAVWIKADSQALVSLRTRRIEPEYVLDLAELVKPHKGRLGPALRDLHAYLEEAKEAGATGFVLDTATSFGKQWLEREYVANAENALGGWATVGNEYIKIFDAGFRLGLRQFWIAQPDVSKGLKAAMAEEAKRNTDSEKVALEKARALTTSTAGEASYIVPALSGNLIMPVIGAQPSLSGWLRKIERNGKTLRQWLPYGTSGATGKNRYEHVLSEIEPPDLWAMDQKILTAAGVKTPQTK